MKYIKLLIVVTLACIIAVFSLYRVELAAGSGNDKIAHFFAYFVLVLTSALLRPKSIVFYTITAIIYGGLIELIQPVFGRETETLDFVANAIGATSGGILGFAAARLFKIKRQTS